MISRKGQVEIGTFIGLLVLTILGIAVVVSTANDVVGDVTGTTTVTNETIVATNGTTVTLANANGNNIVSASDVITNRSATYTLIRNTNYTINLAAGTVTFLNVSDSFNDSTGTARGFISYQYRDEQYSDSAATRSLLDIIPVMLALAVLIAVAAIGLKEYY